MLLVRILEGTYIIKFKGNSLVGVYKNAQLFKNDQIVYVSLRNTITQFIIYYCLKCLISYCIITGSQMLLKMGKMNIDFKQWEIRNYDKYDTIFSHKT